jgi:hypothetical protein
VGVDVTREELEQKKAAVTRRRAEIDAALGRKPEPAISFRHERIRFGGRVIEQLGRWGAT